MKRGDIVKQRFFPDESPMTVESLQIDYQLPLGPGNMYAICTWTDAKGRERREPFGTRLLVVIKET